MVNVGCRPDFTNCKSVIRKWFRRRKSVPSSSKREKDSIIESQNQTQQEDKQERNAINRSQSCRCNGDPSISNDPTCSTDLYRHESIDNGFPSSGSVSRNASTRAHPINKTNKKTTRSGPIPCSSSLRNPSPTLSKSARLNINKTDKKVTKSGPTPTPCYSTLRNPSPKPSKSARLNINQTDKKATKSGPIPCSSSLRNPSPTLSKSARLNSTPIMFSNSSGMLKPPPIEKKLECTLEELCHGCKKKLKITREVLTDTGGIVQEEEILTIEVQPGWRKGTKINFEGKGNERPGAYREDIIFIINEKRHHMFRRVGDDLELAVQIPLLKALTGCTIPIPLLGGEQMNLTIDDIVNPGYEKMITGQGMPISTEPGKRGDLKLKFLVQFPAHLTNDQRSEVVSILQDSCRSMT